ncbi:MAG: flagellar hook-length control protein FliK [Minwuia sp.]|nr:flagellar hook-length control protein FliK [Minwuia sp.]
MQPNALFSAPVGAPPGALKAGKPPVQAPGDAGRPNDIRQDRKEPSTFARMVNDKANPSEARKSAGTEKADGAQEPAASAKGKDDVVAPVSASEVDATTAKAADGAEVTAGDTEQPTDALQSAKTLDAEIDPEISAPVPGAAPADVVAEAATVDGDEAAIIAASSGNSGQQQAVAEGRSGSDDADTRISGSLSAQNGQPETIKTAPLTPDSAQSATQSATQAAAQVADVAAEAAPAQPKTDAPRVDLASNAKPEAANAPVATTSDRPTASGLTPDASARIAEAAAGTVTSAGDDTMQSMLRPSTAAMTATPADFAQPTAVPAATAPQAIQTSAPMQTLAAATPQAMVPDAPAQQLAVHVTRAAKEGADRIEIQLKPAELGRVDVKMEIGHDGRVMAVVSAERADTLDMLRRDVQQLERALTQAGFNTDRESFSFAERGGEGREQANGGGQGNGGGDVADAEAGTDTANPTPRRMAFDKPGVDVKV